MQQEVAGIRKNYASKTLTEAEVDKHPIRQFEAWWQEAVSAAIDEVNAMTLATASADGLPAARIVLLKGFSNEGFTFFSNYHSYKGRQLEENPKACLVFFWKELERQVRITGIVKKISEEQSQQYFLSRPRGSQVGAVASPQSQPVESREWLENQYAFAEKITEGKAVEKPVHWGGYLVQPVVMEFWQGRPSRLHDRIQYSLQADGTWIIERLAP